MDPYRQAKYQRQAYERYRNAQKVKDADKPTWPKLVFWIIGLIMVGSVINMIANTPKGNPRKAEDERRRQFEKEQRQKDIENLQRALCETQPWLERCR